MITDENGDEIPLADYALMTEETLAAIRAALTEIHGVHIIKWATEYHRLLVMHRNSHFIATVSARAMSAMTTRREKMHKKLKGRDGLEAIKPVAALLDAEEAFRRATYLKDEQ